MIIQIKLNIHLAGNFKSQTRQRTSQFWFRLAFIAHYLLCRSDNERHWVTSMLRQRVISLKDFTEHQETYIGAEKRPVRYDHAKVNVRRVPRASCTRMYSAVSWASQGDSSEPRLELKKNQGGESSEEVKLASCPQRKVCRAGSGLMDVGREEAGTEAITPDPGT